MIELLPQVVTERPGEHDQNSKRSGITAEENTQEEGLSILALPPTHVEDVATQGGRREEMSGQTHSGTGRSRVSTELTFRETTGLTTCRYPIHVFEGTSQ